MDFGAVGVSFLHGLKQMPWYGWLIFLGIPMLKGYQRLRKKLRGGRR